MGLAAPFAINGNGDIVGARWNGSRQVGFFRAADGTLVDAVPAGSVGYVALVDINDSGQSVGLFSRDGRVVPFSWTLAGGIVELPLDAGEWQGGGALGINDPGEMVGWARRLGPGEVRAYLWSPTQGPVDLGNLGSATRPEAINDAGILVGYADGWPLIDLARQAIQQLSQV